MKSASNGDANQMGWFDVKHLVVCSALCWNPGRLAEVGYLVMDILVVDGKKGFDEVLFGQFLPAGVDADKNVGDILFRGFRFDL